MTETTARRISAILAEECGYAADDPDWLVLWLLAGSPEREFRFQGCLGFGGKFWSSDWRVTYYPEDMTDERYQAIQKANARLQQLREEVGRGDPECPACGGTLTIHGTVDMGPDVSDGDPCLDCVDWIGAGRPAKPSASECHARQEPGIEGFVGILGQAKVEWARREALREIRGEEEGRR